MFRDGLFFHSTFSPNHLRSVQAVVYIEPIFESTWKFRKIQRQFCATKTNSGWVWKKESSRVGGERECSKNCFSFISVDFSFAPEMSFIFHASFFASLSTFAVPNCVCTKRNLSNDGDYPQQCRAFSTDFQFHFFFYHCRMRTKPCIDTFMDRQAHVHAHIHVAWAMTMVECMAKLVGILFSNCASIIHIMWVFVSPIDVQKFIHYNLNTCDWINKIFCSSK